MNPGLTKNRVAGGAVADRRFVKPHSTAGQIVQAAAATDLIIGVSCQPGGAASGAPCDFHITGLVEVDCGGTVGEGAPVTADSNGKAVAAAPSTGANARVAGIAYDAGVSGDIIRVLLGPGYIQGA